MERRQFTRIILSAPVTIQRDTQQWQTTLVDLSLKGILINEPAEFNCHINDFIVLAINIESLPAPITLEGPIVHIEGGHVGVACQRMDIDSITELRRLIELNMGDDVLLHRELHTLGNG